MSGVHVQIFSGGRNWAKSLDFAKNLVKSRGGPGLLLARSKGHKANAVAGVSRARLLLEIIAVYELFGNLFPPRVPTCIISHMAVPVLGCLARGRAPALLNIDCWWYVHQILMCSMFHRRPRLTKTNAHDNVSYIDKVFGMSREFILILAQVSPDES